MISGNTPLPESKNAAPAPQGVPVVVATDSRLMWRSLAAWIKVAGASLTAVIICLSEEQDIIRPLLSAKYAYIGAVIFAAGQCMEAVQKHLDVSRQKAIVNFTPQGGNE